MEKNTKKLTDVGELDHTNRDQPAPKEMLNNVFRSGDLVEGKTGIQIVVATMSVPPGEVHLAGKQRIMCIDEWGQVSSWVSADNFSLVADHKKREEFLTKLADRWGVEVDGLSQKWTEITTARYFVDNHPFG